MSGPKVVRIVTREEKIADSKAFLSRLDESVKNWERGCIKKGFATEKEFDAIKNRRQQIHELLNNDQFTDLQNQVQGEIAFLVNDIQLRKDKAAEAVANAHTIRRRLSNTAATLIESISKTDIDIPDELLNSLQNVNKRKIDDINDAENVINRTMALLTPVKTDELITDRQREIANKLGNGEATTTLNDWLEGRPSKDDEAGQKIDHHLAELIVEEGSDYADPFIQRASNIASEPSPNRRKLLYDSLIIDLAKNERERHKYQDEIQTAMQLASEIELYDNNTAEDIRSRVKNLNDIRDLQKVQSIIKEAISFLEIRKKEISAQSRRKAILQGLASLGYEIREGMMTAWADNGRVVIKKATNQDYGVELSGAKDATKLQVRAVAFGATTGSRNKERDIDAESIWCSEFGQLKNDLAQSGNEIIIEKAKKVGEVPLKVIETGGFDDRDIHHVSTQKQQKTNL